MEAAAAVDPDSVEWQRLRAQVYQLEANDLFKAGAQHTVVKLFDCVGPSLTAVMEHAKDAETLRPLAWARWSYANALQVTGRGEDAVRIADDAIDHIDPACGSGPRLRQLVRRLPTSVDCAPERGGLAGGPAGSARVRRPAAGRCRLSQRPEGPGEPAPV